MSNPARDLLNYVDEHKTEMKDDTYKGIVDRLTPINKALDNIKRSQYKAIFMTTTFDDNEDGGEIDTMRKEFKVYLSEDEAKQVNKKLDEWGAIHHFFHNFDLSKHQGIHYLSEFRNSLIMHHNKVILNIDTRPYDEDAENSFKKLPYFYSKNASLVRLVKV